MSTAIVGVGAYSPLGFDARQTALGLRARKLVPRPMSFTDAQGERFASARALGLGDDVVGADRMIELGARALREAMRDAGIAPTEPVRIFVAFPEKARQFPEDEARRIAATSFLPLLERRSGQRIDGAGSEVLRLGHAGFAVALERAIAVLGKGGPIAVGGIDTYHHPEILASLDRDKRLLSESAHNGFIPSEGAAFIVLAPKTDRRPVARVMHSFAGVEQLPPDEPRTAALMTELVRRAGTEMRANKIPWIITDVNGERHRAKEWSFVAIRNNDVIVQGETVEDHIGQLIGDAGAVTGAFAAVHAAVAFRTGFAPASQALLALHSDGDERGVVVIEAVS